MANRKGEYVIYFSEEPIRFFFYWRKMGLVENQKIKIRWAGNNRKYYEEKGYVFTSYKDYIDVAVEDLTPSNSKKVNVICDRCGKQTNISYHHYLNGINLLRIPYNRIYSTEKILEKELEKYKSHKDIV